MFQTIVGNAEWKGMKVNGKKTPMMFVSDATSFVPRAFFLDEDGSRVESKDKTTKLLRFTLSDRVGAHVEALRRRLRQKFWTLLHLRDFGFTQEELVKVYRVNI